MMSMEKECQLAARQARSTFRVNMNELATDLRPADSRMEPRATTAMNRDGGSSSSSSDAESPTSKTGRAKAPTCDKPAAARAHFRIDWRQLTYYQKPDRLALAELLRVPWRRRAKLAQWDESDSMSEETSLSLPSVTTSHQSDPPTAGWGARKRILNSLDGCFKSGQLNAVLGPSGAGKSTFLSALFGNKQDASYGHTRVTWLADEQTEAKMEKERTIKIAFLPQQDHLLNHLTVYETLLFASKIKNPAHSNDTQFHRCNVKRVAKMLKLTDCFNTRCGRLSGGQYKRVSIGQELLSEPDVIILDEPTSGLDAMTCLTTVRTLKAIVTKHPISIILTIHQPDTDVFNLFDKVYVIAQGGLAIYEGPPGELVATMARVNLFMPSDNYNPARFIVENAFVADLDSTPAAAAASASPGDAAGGASTSALSCSPPTSDDEDDDHQHQVGSLKQANLLSRSISSLTEALSGKQVDLMPGGGGGTKADGRRPLLNIGIQTADGKLITSELLAADRQLRQLEELRAKEQLERLSLLRRLNRLQKARYYRSASEPTVSAPADVASSQSVSLDERADVRTPEAGTLDGASTASSSSLNSFYSEARDTFEEEEGASSRGRQELAIGMSCELEQLGPGRRRKPRRQFDKRLSARHNQSRQRNYPIWYHSFLLTHRTWLSIVRDPIFFGIQFAMHTTIPILLAVIFGSHQEEGCPQVGNFDLVEFAYQPDGAHFIQTTMRSIRQSIGNIGVIFFEMFVLSFAINCITALVFPLDMHVLLKEYRNGWYSLSSYFFGRTLADLPVPVVLHSMAMAILYYLTGQPLAWWRFGALIAIVILASLVAQSVGLTIGALLMRSSQSAVLAAAGIVAPFFALSGFIVRIHTLPLVARLAAHTSYLYHLLNGFIILRYGFGRCPCCDDDFQAADAHPIPQNLRTMASIWIGTYSSEYELESRRLGAHNLELPAGRLNRSNLDPNIDVIDKLVGAFRMANSFGHKVETCEDVVPYAMLDFNLKDADITFCCVSLLLMLILSRVMTFCAIYYKIRSFS